MTPDEYVKRTHHRIRRRDRIASALVMTVAGAICAIIGYLAAPLLMALIGAVL